jgi:hypothetical protein
MKAIPVPREIETNTPQRTKAAAANESEAAPSRNI